MMRPLHDEALRHLQSQEAHILTPNDLCAYDHMRSWLDEWPADRDIPAKLRDRILGFRGRGEHPETQEEAEFRMYGEGK